MEQNYRHTEAMGEISGFGGGYESCCQDMFEAGVKWLHEKEQVNLEASTFKNIYGIFTAESDDAKELEKVVIEASHNQASGAMHHAVMSRIFYVSANGWDKYVEECSNRKGAN